MMALYNRRIDTAHSDSYCWVLQSARLPLSSLFFFECYGDHRDLPSFPTRRSSDLPDLPHGATVADWLTRRDLGRPTVGVDRKSTRLNSSHVAISYAVFCLKKKKSRVWLLCETLKLVKPVY